MSNSRNEMLLTENENRYVMFPIVDEDIWKIQKTNGLLLTRRRNRFIKRYQTLGHTQ